MGFEPWISDNWATATSDFLFLLFFMSSPLQCRAQNATGSPLTSLDDVAVLVVLLHQPSVQVRILRPPEEEENLFVPERTRRRSPSFPDPITEIEIFRRRRNLKKWSIKNLIWNKSGRKSRWVDYFSSLKLFSKCLNVPNQTFLRWSSWLEMIRKI